MEETSCEPTLVEKGPDEKIGAGVAIVGSGPYTRLAARQAAEFSRSDPDAGVPLLNVQRPSEDGEYDPEEEGRALIESVAKEADVDQNYEERALVTDGDIRETLPDAVEEYDTICVGATRSTAVAQVLFGSIPEEIGEQSEGTVALARRAPQTTLGDPGPARLAIWPSGSRNPCTAGSFYRRRLSSVGRIGSA